MSEDRRHAHELIDRLPDGLSALVGSLRNAPIDDEPETDQEKQAIIEAHEWLDQNGKAIPHEEAMGRLGLE
jgi:hypothetical protein